MAALEHNIYSAFFGTVDKIELKIIGQIPSPGFRKDVFEEVDYEITNLEEYRESLERLDKDYKPLYLIKANIKLNAAGHMNVLGLKVHNKKELFEKVYKQEIDIDKNGNTEMVLLPSNSTKGKNINVRVYDDIKDLVNGFKTPLKIEFFSVKDKLIYQDLLLEKEEKEKIEWRKF